MAYKPQLKQGSKFANCLWSLEQTALGLSSPCSSDVCSMNLSFSPPAAWLATSIIRFFFRTCYYPLPTPWVLQFLCVLAYFCRNRSTTPPRKTQISTFCGIRSYRIAEHRSAGRPTNCIMYTVSVASLTRYATRFVAFYHVPSRCPSRWKSSTAGGLESYPPFRHQYLLQSSKGTQINKVCLRDMTCFAPNNCPSLSNHPGFRVVFSYLGFPTHVIVLWGISG